MEQEKKQKIEFTGTFNYKNRVVFSAGEQISAGSWVAKAAIKAKKAKLINEKTTKNGGK